MGVQQVTIRIPPELLRRIRQAAALESLDREGPLSVNAWIRKTIERRLDRDQAINHALKSKLMDELGDG